MDKKNIEKVDWEIKNTFNHIQMNINYWYKGNVRIYIACYGICIFLSQDY